MYIIPGKHFNNDGNQKITLAVKTNFSFDFGLVFAISSSCFWPLNNGNQLPVCRLFSMCDVYIHRETIKVLVVSLSLSLFFLFIFYFISRNYTTMTVPIIDGIDHETFAYKPVYQVCI